MIKIIIFAITKISSRRVSGHCRGADAATIGVARCRGDDAYSYAARRAGLQALRESAGGGGGGGDRLLLRAERSKARDGSTSCSPRLREREREECINGTMLSFPCS